MKIFGAAAKTLLVAGLISSLHWTEVEAGWVEDLKVSLETFKQMAIDEVSPNGCCVIKTAAGSANDDVEIVSCFDELPKKRQCAAAAKSVGQTEAWVQGQSCDAVSICLPAD